MKLDQHSGLLEGVPYLASPNYDDRPEGQAIDLIVVHGISLPPGEFGGCWIDDLFGNCLDPDIHPYFKEIQGLKVSSHFLIRRDGEIKQYVPVTKRAWHAGVSSFKGRDACNDYSIGIELEGEDDTPYESVQYAQLLALISALLEAYPDISEENIVGHADIAPGRKTDPGAAFEWGDFRRKLRVRLASCNDVEDT